MKAITSTHLQTCMVDDVASVDAVQGELWAYIADVQDKHPRAEIEIQHSTAPSGYNGRPILTILAIAREEVNE